MSKFKEQLAKDLDVFINKDEFSELHILNGVKLNCIVNSNAIGNRKYNRAVSFDDGLYEFNIEVIYKYDDYPQLLVYNSVTSFDNGQYNVSNFALDDGIATLKLAMVNG